MVNNLPNFSENNRTVNQCSCLCTAAPPLRKIEERDFATQTSLFSSLSEGRGRLYTGYQCSRILLWNHRRRFRGSQLGRKIRRVKSFQAWAPGNIVLPDQFLTRPGFWLVPESVCVFLPNQRAANLGSSFAHASNWLPTSLLECSEFQTVYIVSRVLGWDSKLKESECFHFLLTSPFYYRVKPKIKVEVWTNLPGNEHCYWFILHRLQCFY